MRWTVSASTSNSVCPPVNRRAAIPEITTCGIYTPGALLRRNLHRLAVERRAKLWRGHRQVAHAGADGVGDRVGDGGHRRHDRHLTDTLGAERMPRVRHLD